MKKLMLSIFSLCLLTSSILPSADDADIKRYLGQYQTNSDSTVMGKKITGWSLLSLLLTDAPQALGLTSKAEQARLQDFVSISLYPANKWTTAHSDTHLLTISALNGLAQLLQTHLIDDTTTQKIFISHSTTNPSILSQLQQLIPAYIEMSDHYPQLKEAVYGFLRSYHDRFGHQAFIDFPALPAWIQKEVENQHTLVGDLELLFEKMKHWIQRSPASAASLERDAE